MFCFLKKDSFSPKSWFQLIEPSCFWVVLDEKSASGLRWIFILGIFPVYLPTYNKY